MEERNSAQVRIAAAEDTATQAFEEVGNMRDEVADLKERLVKVRCPALPVCAPVHFNRLKMGGMHVHPAAWPCRRLSLKRGVPIYVVTIALLALQATQEKVAALMQAADAKGSRRTSAGGRQGAHPLALPRLPPRAAGGG